jgi:hypothetical protein
VAVGSHGGWRLEGDKLIVDKGATLPSLCVYDGSAVGGAPVHKKLTWVPPWVTILVLLSPVIYIIVALVVRKTGEIGYYLSEEAKRRRATGVTLMIASFVALVGFVIVSVAAETPALILVGMLAFLLLLIVGAVRMKTFMLTRIDEQSLHFKLRPSALEAFSRFGR